MAKIKLGSNLADIRGKLNGHVFSHNKGGNYVRNKVTPVNPRTSAQVAVRNRLGSLAQSFRGLTQAQIIAWNGAVNNFAKTNIFGDLHSPSGINLYQRLNNNLLNIGVAQISDPPSSSAIPITTALSVTAAKGIPALSVVLSNAVPVGSKVKVLATAGISPGRTFVKSQFRQIAVLAAAQATPYNGLAAYTAVFGAIPVAGQKLFIKLMPVNSSTGQAGVTSQVSCIVAV
jgi:hypothetical protein